MEAPTIGELPAEIPVFPLSGALLLPGGRLPLNIFEPRYLAMVEDAMADGRLFGMVQPDRSRPEVEDEPPLYGVGCLGRVSAFSETQDGRFLITLTGLVRFDVEREAGRRRGYRRVRARYDRFGEDLDPAELTLPDRPGLLGALRAYFTANGFEANWDAVNEMPDAALVLTLAMACPFGAAEKQALLEAPTAAVQAETLLALLQMGAHGEGGSRPA